MGSSTLTMRPLSSFSKRAVGDLAPIEGEEMFPIMLSTCMLLLLAPADWGGKDDRSRGPATPISVWQSVPPDTEITLLRTNCYGGCPVYSLTIYADGRVVYRGGENAKKRGKIDSHISQEKLKELIAAFNAVNYFSLDVTYDHGSKDCPSWGTDAPYAITSLTLNKKKQVVRHYLGCSGSPTVGKLAWLESKIDEAVNVKQWIE